MLQPCLRACRGLHADISPEITTTVAAAAAAAVPAAVPAAVIIAVCRVHTRVRAHSVRVSPYSQHLTPALRWHPSFGRNGKAGERERATQQGASARTKRVAEGPSAEETATETQRCGPSGAHAPLLLLLPVRALLPVRPTEAALPMPMLSKPM